MFGNPDTNDWISERLLEIESHRDHFDTLPFKIIELKDSGFLTKVKGLYAYISFYHMPWKYYTADSWIAIAPSLIGKVFFCKIYRIDKDPISILLNGEFPQFKKSELAIGEEYNGLIIKITDSELILDIGCHFDWNCGSLTGLLHKSKFADNEKIGDFKLGQKITTYYQKGKENGQLLFSNDREEMDWQLGIPQALVGQKTWAKVIPQPDSKKIDLLVRGKYKANFTNNKQSHPMKIRRKINRLKKGLNDGEIINCEVIGFIKKSRSLLVDWPKELVTDVIYDNSLLSNLDNETLDKLKEALTREELRSPESK